MEMQLSRVVLEVRDVARSVEFYPSDVVPLTCDEAARISNEDKA